jgi:hypothetical protein
LEEIRIGCADEQRALGIIMVMAGPLLHLEDGLPNCGTMLER